MSVRRREAEGFFSDVSLLSTRQLSHIVCVSFPHSVCCELLFQCWPAIEVVVGTVKSPVELRSTEWVTKASYCAYKSAFLCLKHLLQTSTYCSYKKQQDFFLETSVNRGTQWMTEKNKKARHTSLDHIKIKPRNASRLVSSVPIGSEARPELLCARWNRSPGINNTGID